MTEHAQDQVGGDISEEVRVAIGTLTSPWTLAQLASAVGVDEAAVRPYVQRMIEGGTVHELGPDPRSEMPDALLYGPRPFEDRPN